MDSSEAQVKDLVEFIEEKDQEDLNDMTDEIHNFLLDFRNDPRKTIHDLEKRKQDLDSLKDRNNLKSVLISLITRFISSI